MAYAEFVEQLAYYRSYRWGDDWEQSSTQSWAAIAPHVKRRLKPDDFRPKPARLTRKPRQTPQQMASLLNMLAQQGVIRGGGNC